MHHGHNHPAESLRRPTSPMLDDTKERHFHLNMDRAFSIAMNEPHVSPMAFVIAGIAGLLARVRNTSSLLLVHDGRPLKLSVDVLLPFNNLIVEVELALQQAGGFDVQVDSFHFEDETPKADAYVSFATGPAIGELGSGELAGEALRFLARKDGDDWELLLTASGWPETQMERTLGYLKTLLESAAQDPTRPTGTLRLIEEDAALERYHELNRTQSALPAGTMLDLVADSANVYSDTNAVTFGGSALSYAELDRQSEILAGVLRARGANQEKPVAICLTRSEKMPIVLLAVLKAGSYFVPLDPSHPRQRQIDIVAECKPAVLLVSKETQLLFAETELPVFDPFAKTAGVSPGSLDAVSPASPRPGGNDKAYMIYTSGTTGRPKGVIIRHRSLLNVLLAMRERPGLAPGDRMLAIATLSFDISILDMFLPLITGATLVIASEQEARDPWKLAKLLDVEKITCMQATPVTWRMLLASGYEARSSLKMIAGGEALSRDLANGLLRTGGELWNCYGPTETTIYSSVLRVQEGDGPVPIGPPLANTAFYVADAAGQLLPPEVAGELYIGGAGVAAGYYERAELQAERFVLDHWTLSGDTSVQQPKLFRSGDLVRLTEDGRGFEFFGRIDHQVKLRGYRIELGEVEMVLRTYPALATARADAAVVLREDEPGEPWLIAYVASGAISGAVSAKDLLEFAARRLPQYMLPSRIVMLPTLPVTGSGKVDRRALAALPAPADAVQVRPQEDRRSATATPLNATEAALLKIFREVLRLKSFGPDDNFFEYGGYSLLAMRLFARIGAVLHKHLPITALFDAPTVRGLAALVHRGDSLQALVPIREQGQEPPFFLVHSYLLYGLIRHVVEDDRPVYGLRERLALSSQPDMEHCVDEYVTEIQRFYPRGPVHLGGWCAAASLTIEIARRLMAEGRTVGMVALFDADAPGFVAQTPGGSPRLAGLRARTDFHRGRMRGMTWTGRLRYLWERLTQVPVNLVEKFYLRNHLKLLRWQKHFPWLPGALFYNRFTQVGLLQAERLEQIDARIQLFRARDVTMIPGSDEALGWGEIARQGVDVTFIPGHHESMFLQPNVEVLQDRFRASIRTIEGKLALRPPTRSTL